jgi:hypothetical protein
MKTSDVQQFEKGQTYLVSHRQLGANGQPEVIRKTRRIFKGLESRFGTVPCAVFTTRVGPATSATYDEVTGMLSISGKRVPRSEVSIPHYNLETVESVT